jgi:hypothetical protein
MRALRILVASISAVALLPLLALPASAAPPANDEVGGAVPLKVGDRVVQDTTQATTTPEDAALNEACGAPVTNASVWYSFTPAVNRKVVLDMTASDYSGGFLLFEGTPSVDSLTDCSEGVLGLEARAGTTYNIMVISDTEANGGKLVLSLKKAPPPPRVRVTLAKRGVVLRGPAGAARLHGTYFCAHGDFSELFGNLFQRAGRLKITGFLGKSLRCDGRRHAWKARAVSDFATFARGRARARVSISACGFFECRGDTARHRVRLAGPGGGARLRSMPDARHFVHPRPLVTSQDRWPGH